MERRGVIAALGWLGLGVGNFAGSFSCEFDEIGAEQNRRLVALSLVVLELLVFTSRGRALGYQGSY